ncbi:MAG: FHA domain-containing protein [Planctomycetota bacterium]|nr:MAG: FHA domain-containing protein [Planctomycetota bacterium]
MKFLQSFLKQNQAYLQNPSDFCARHPYPFLLTVQEEEEEDTPAKEEDFETEFLEELAAIKFETDKIKLEDILTLKNTSEDVCVIPLKKKDSPTQMQMITLGRTANNDIHLPFKGISKLHAYFKIHNLQTTITDADSTNGTFVNGKKLKSSQATLLKDRDILSFAKLFHFFYFSPSALYHYFREKQIL